MTEVQNKGKGPRKGKKAKNGSLAKRSLTMRVATVLLSLLTILLIILGILYLARGRHWFPLTSSQSQTAPHQPDQMKTDVSGKNLSVPAEEGGASPLSSSGQAQLIPQKGGGPRVAIIVDDLGADITTMQDLLDLELNLTAAILPNVPGARAAAELAHGHGREVLLHIPMEPLDYPSIHPGENALMVGLSAAQIRTRLESYLQTVPWVVGANNHMGSRFTENREGMGEVLKVLKERGLFFVDSRTTANSLAISETRRLKIPHAQRDLFLDNELNEGAIREQIRRLIEIAREEGSAVGICHPHLVTYSALKKEAPAFAAAGVSLVPVSVLLN